MFSKVTREKTAVKDLLSKEFRLTGDIDYEGICIDDNFSLYRTFPENCKNTQWITASYVAKNIKLLLHSIVATRFGAAFSFLRVR